LALIGRWIAQENPGKAPTGIGSHATAKEKEIGGRKNQWAWGNTSGLGGIKKCIHSIGKDYGI